MYKVIDIENNIISILDTKDDSIEKISKTTLSTLIQLGIAVDTVLVRFIKKSDLKELEKLIELNKTVSFSINCDLDEVREYLEDNSDNDYYIGCFVLNDLVGYASLGGADAIGKNGRLLSDLWVCDKEQGKGYGKIIIKFACSECLRTKEQLWLEPWEDWQHDWYKSLGFIDKDGAMLYVN